MAPKLQKPREAVRIGIDVTPLAVPGSGIGRYVAQLVKHLPELADEEELVLCGRRPAGRDPLAAEPWRAAPGARVSRDRALPLERWLKPIRTFGAGRLDLFHATNYLPPLRMPAPTVLTVHDLSVQLLPWSHDWKRRTRHRMLPALCHRATRVIADSVHTKRDLVRIFRLPAHKIDVVYLAASEELRRDDSAAARRRVRKRYALPPRFVLFVGSLDPRKNLAALIGAHARLRRHGAAPPLVIAGRGAPRHVARLLRLAEAEGSRQGADLLLAGHVEEADLAALYGLCELFVYPSLHEGFGLPPLEAMACGAPVLVPANSAFRELYRDTPLLFDMDRPDDLQRAMGAALVSPARRRLLVEHGRKRAEARSWRQVAEETLACYRRALAEAAP